MEHNRDSMKQVVLPWRRTGSPANYGLGISMLKKRADSRPTWTFYKDLEPVPQVEWTYATQDVSLIHNMLLCFFPDETFVTDQEVEEEPEPEPTPVGKRSKKKTTTETKKEIAPILRGSIEKLQLECLIQSLAASRVTGKLTLSSRNQNGCIFFEEGIPVHCFMDEEHGHNAMLQLLTWRSGNFDLYADERAPTKSITRRIESLLLESAALADYVCYLERAKIDEKTVLEKVPMSYAEFVERMKDAPDLDEELLRAIGRHLDMPTSIEELAARLNLSRPDWLPVIYGFVKSGVVRVSQEQVSAQISHLHLILTHAEQIDEKGFLDDLTGLYSDAAFDFFLQLELARAQDHRGVFSIIFFDMPGQFDNNYESEKFLKFVHDIRLSCGASDLMCRVKPSGIAIILPDTGRDDAQLILESLTERCLCVEESEQDPSAIVPLKIGAACYPADGRSIDKLLQIALG